MMSTFPNLLQWLSRPRLVERMNVDRQREWRRAVRAWKFGVKVRAKLGMIQTLCDEVDRDRRNGATWVAPDWGHPLWVEQLFEAIRDNKHPRELLKGFVESAEVTFFASQKQPKPERVLEAVDKVYKQLSRRLRAKFGVFTTT